MIENTSQRDPLLHLLGAMSEGTGDYITGMEADGQQQLVQSDRIPTDDLGRGGEQALLDLGFTLGDPDPTDPLFRLCTLPEGWARQGSDHAMWSYIVDQLGRRRVAVFYKAAFYDRGAHYSVETVGSYVSALLYAEGDDPALIVDDEWATTVALTEALTEERDRALERTRRYTQTDPEYAAEHSARAARAERLLASLKAKLDQPT